MGLYSVSTWALAAKSENLDWVFLMDWILALFASITIIFHFNRYVGSFISFLLRLYVWKRYRMRIKVRAVKVSFLGGRIFFKNLVIITQNETISVLQGTLTWRYWLNNTMHTDLEMDNTGKDKTRNETLPSRFLLQLYGLEWFMYNRVYAYENLMETMARADAGSGAGSGASASADASTVPKDAAEFTMRSSTETAQSDDGAAPHTAEPADYHRDPAEIGFFSYLNCLPLSIDVKKGAVVLGNRTTSSILVVSYAQGNGIMDLSRSGNCLDPYRSVFKMEFSAPKVMMKRNVGYRGPDSPPDGAAASAETEYHPVRRRDVRAVGRALRLARRVARVLSLQRQRHARRLRRQRQHQATSQTSPESQWHGLRQYLDDGAAGDRSGGATVTVNHDEYAKYSCILEAASVAFSYYFDVAGTVPARVNMPRADAMPAEVPDIGNCGPAPVYGMFWTVSRGLVHYGPWAHRERLGLQKMLFPSACRGAQPQEPLAAGDDRKYTGFKLEVSVADELVVRVPFREFSKNTKVETDAGQQQAAQQKQAAQMDATATDGSRPAFGWLELKVQAESSMVTDVSYVATADRGWDNKVHVDLAHPELRTSTNHEILFKSARHVLQADVGFPLQWNGLTDWQFHNRSEDTELFLLREHVTLLSDVAADFAYGEPTPYELFKPFIYGLDVEFARGYKLYLNVNDHNVINNPLDFNDNVYVSFQGETLRVHADIPMDRIVRRSTCVSYLLSTDRFDLVLDAPPWHTANNFLKSRCLGRAHAFAIAGSYTYYSAMDLDAVDSIVIDCTCEDTVLELYGFVLRYMLIVKENYFGVHRTFKTLAEYTRPDANAPAPPPKHQKLETDLDLVFSFALQRGCAVLPGHMYDCDAHVALYFDALDVDIRYTNYYMDMQCDISEIRGSTVAECVSQDLIDGVFGCVGAACAGGHGDAEGARHRAAHRAAHTVSIASVAVHGHRMFGLPPLEPTYFCKWDFALGSVVVSRDPAGVGLLQKSVRNLAFLAKDVENLLVSAPTVLHDVVVITFNCPSIDIRLVNRDGSALQVAMAPFEFDFNDFANDRYSKRSNIKIRSIVLSVVSPAQQVLAQVQTSLHSSNFVQEQDPGAFLAAQQQHLALHDAPFHRLPFLIKDGRGTEYRQAYGSITPVFSIPALPPPVNAQTVDLLFEEFPEDDTDTGSFAWDAPGFPPPASSSAAAAAGPASRTYYTDSDYAPSTPPEPGYETLSMVLSCGAVDGYVDPDALGIVVDVLDAWNTFTLESVMDTLHIDTILGLAQLRADLSTTVNCRIVIPSINIRYAPVQAPAWPDYWEVTAQTVSAVVSRKVSKTKTAAVRLMDQISIVKEAFAALHVRELAASVYRLVDGTGHTKVAAVGLHDIEFWSALAKLEGFVSSTNTRTLEVSVDADALDWAQAFVTSNADHILEAARRLKAIMARSKAATVQLLYDVSTASTRLRIQHDPAVLTKPAYIMRSSDRHIRMNDSWKVVIRLRHIIKSLPAVWKTTTNRSFGDASSRPADVDACSVVLNTFKNWRSWEFTDISRCYLFIKVFDLPSDSTRDQVSASAARKNASVAFESLSVNLTSLDHGNDCICVDFLNATISSDTQTDSNEYAGIGVESFTGPVVRVTLTLESLRDRLSPLSLRVVDTLKGFIGKSDSDADGASAVESTVGSTAGSTAESSAKPSAGSSLPSVAFDISALVHATEHRVHLDKTGLSSTGAGFSFSAFGVAQRGLSGNLPLNAIMASEKVSCDVFLDGDPVGIFSGKDGFSVFSNTGTLAEGLKHFKVSWAEMLFKCDRGTDEFILLLDTMINHDMKIVKDIVASLPHKGPSGDPQAQAAKRPSIISKCPVIVDTDIDKISWDLELVSPIKATGSVYGFKTRSHVARDVLISEVAVASMHTNFTSSDHVGGQSPSFYKADATSLQAFTKLILAEDYDMLNMYIRSEKAVLSVPQLIESLNTAIASQILAKDSWQKLKHISVEIMDLFVKPHDTDVMVDSPGKKPLLMKVSFKNKYAGIFTRVERTNYRIDTSETAYSATNYALSAENDISKVKFHGAMTFPSTRFAINTGSKDLVVLSIDVAVKVMLAEAQEALQSLQVELHYCRLFVTPDILIKVLTLRKAVSSLWGKLDIASPKSASDSTVGAPVVEPQPHQGSVFGFYSIHILAYNICLGWIFDDPRCQRAGVIAGCERIFVVCEEKVGKLTLVDAFLSLAHGSSPSSFFSPDGEFDTSSRAFLPNMQLTYAILEDAGLKDVHASVSGEQLDVRLEADGVNIAEDLLHSFNNTKGLITKRKLLKIQNQKEPAPTVSIGSVGFHSVECITKFAGAKVFIYNNDADVLQSCSSFTLESPAVKIAFEYLHLARADIKHKVEVEIITSSSKNILHATCVPVLNNLYRGVRKMMKTSGSASDPGSSTLSTKADANSSASAFFDDIEIDFGVKVEPQEIVLSCEPTAKVEAAASCGGLDLRIGMCRDSKVWQAVLQLEELKASLQHVYSRETSGSIDVNSLLLTAFYDVDNSKKITCATFVSEMDGFVNVKQLQDLDLFRDIWVPKEYYKEYSDQLGLRGDTAKRITQRTRETSSSAAMPWIIQLLVSKINFTVDMGISLGILKLDADRVWALSKKSVNWEQSLRLAIDSVALSSEGRLGGEIVIQDATLATAISWVVNERTYEHPLVVISAAIGSIQTKSSLDFHTFFVGNLQDFSLNIFNKRGPSETAHDSLFATVEVGELKAFSTALAASNFFDIYNTALRIHQGIQISYREVLKDSSTKSSDVMLKQLNQADSSLADILNGLTTKLDVDIKRVLFHVYPSSFMDTQVLVLTLERANAKFFQNTAQRLEDRLNFRMKDFTVSLSTYKNNTRDENEFNSMTIAQIFGDSKEVKSGTIFVFPSMFIDMDIFQNAESNVIEYKFKSYFGGKVEIKWNLGSVNFIRDMWMSHANALSSRLESYRRTNARTEMELKAASADRSIFETANLEDRLKEVETDSKYQYVPLEPLIAEMPQLKELGEATPPLEWFGLHREKFPNMTHQMIVISLQKMVHEVETQYGRILK